jgi:acid stress-induced BolA-like protein IbaG/YrbA
MSEPTPAEVQRFIAQGLACDHLEVEGDGRHFFATIVSAEFEGTSRVARHQRVYKALGDRMREQIHAGRMGHQQRSRRARRCRRTPPPLKTSRSVRCGCRRGVGLPRRSRAERRVNPGATQTLWTNS